jgi:hypothetical protein
MNNPTVRCYYYNPRYVVNVFFFFWWLLVSEAITMTYSLGFTNIFGVIHHKTDKEIQLMNDLLQEEDEINSHQVQRLLAWFPPPRSIMIQEDDMVVVDIDSPSSDRITLNMLSLRTRIPNRKNNNKEVTARSVMFHAMNNDEEVI